MIFADVDAGGDTVDENECSATGVGAFGIVRIKVRLELARRRRITLV